MHPLSQQSFRHELHNLRWCKSFWFPPVILLQKLLITLLPGLYLGTGGVDADSSAKTDVFQRHSDVCVISNPFTILNAIPEFDDSFFDPQQGL